MGIYDPSKEHETVNVGMTREQWRKILRIVDSQQKTLTKAMLQKPNASDVKVMADVEIEFERIKMHIAQQI